MSRRCLFARSTSGVGVLVLASACAVNPVQTPTEVTHEPERFQLVEQGVDEATAARLAPLLDSAAVTVERYFGAPFPRPFRVTIHPDRTAFDASFPPEWGMTKTECWMVASGVADGVQLLSPRVWEREACEHDAGDELHVEHLLAHELVHVFHGQHNPSPDFVDVTGIDWFVEGLATLASGQLEDESLLSARDALERGAGPTTLAAAWTGRYRYGVSGSLVAFLEHELGRARLVECLVASSGEELLELLGMSEAELLERWRAWVLLPGTARLQPGSALPAPERAEESEENGAGLEPGAPR